MAAEWYYLVDGKQAGPVELQAMQQMAGMGSLIGSTLVFGPGLTEWTPAGQVAALGVSSHSAGGMPMAGHGEPRFAPGMLGYRGVDSLPSGLTPAAMDSLRQTKPWVRFWGVLLFIGGGFMLLGGLVFALIRSSISSRMGGAPFPTMLGFFYVGLGALYLLPAIFLNRYASHIAALMRTDGMHDLEQALRAQKSFWKFVGIAALVGLCLYAVIIVMVFVIGVSRF